MAKECKNIQAEKSILEGLKWLKSSGYVYADIVLESFNIITNKNYKFKEECWSGGSYYEIIKEKVS